MCLLGTDCSASVLCLFYFVYLYCFIQKKYLPPFFLYLWVPMKRNLLIKILLSPALHLILVASFCHRIQRHMPNGYSRETTVSPAPVKKPQSWSTESGQRTYPDAFCFSGPGSFPMTPLIHNNLVLQILQENMHIRLSSIRNVTLSILDQQQLIMKFNNPIVSVTRHTEEDLSLSLSIYF